MNFQDKMHDLISQDKADELEALVRRLDKKANLGELLILASREGKLRSARKLIDMGADIDYMNYDGETPLSFSCAWNQLDSAKLLQECGADVNLPCNGNSPLDIAVCRTPPEFRNWLKSVGAQRLHEFDEWLWPPPRGGNGADVE